MPLLNFSSAIQAAKTTCTALFARLASSLRFIKPRLAAMCRMEEAAADHEPAKAIQDTGIPRAFEDSELPVLPEKPAFPVAVENRKDNAEDQDSFREDDTFVDTFVDAFVGAFVDIFVDGEGKYEGAFVDGRVDGLLNGRVINFVIEFVPAFVDAFVDSAGPNKKAFVGGDVDNFVDGFEDGFEDDDGNDKDYAKYKDIVEFLIKTSLENNENKYHNYDNYQLYNLALRLATAVKQEGFFPVPIDTLYLADKIHLKIDYILNNTMIKRCNRKRLRQALRLFLPKENGHFINAPWSAAHQSELIARLRKSVLAIAAVAKPALQQAPR